LALLSLADNGGLLILGGDVNGHSNALVENIAVSAGESENFAERVEFQILGGDAFGGLGE